MSFPKVYTASVIKNPERTLWAKVLAEGIKDIMSYKNPKRVSKTSGKPSKKTPHLRNMQRTEHKQALEWAGFDGKEYHGSADFRETCNLAGVEPEAVISALNKQTIDIEALKL